MKKNIENSIKESLEHLELPYNPNSWNAMQDRLDMNATNQSRSSIEQAVKSSLEKYEKPYNASAWKQLEAQLSNIALRKRIKWISFAFALLTLSAGILYSIKGSDNAIPVLDNKINTAKKITTVNTSIHQDSQISVAPDSKQPSSTEVTQEITSISDNVSNTEIPVDHEDLANDFQSNANANDPLISENMIDDQSQFNALQEGDSRVTESEELSQKRLPFVLPIVSSTCKGETIPIANNNKYDVVLNDPNGFSHTLSKMSTTEIKMEVAGTYTIGWSESGVFNEKSSFKVNEAPVADFDIINQNQLYQNGLPVKEITSNTNGLYYEWNIDSRSFSGRTIAPRFFNKGAYSIELTVTGSNGCKSRAKREISIDKDYNLMATTAFDPKSIDVRNNTFMPRALIERKNLIFTLVIVDAKDGHIMFETSDASIGWDGVDRSTGVELEYMETFIWKVTLENNEIGERPVYGGSAIIVPRQR